MALTTQLLELVEGACVDAFDVRGASGRRDTRALFKAELTAANRGRWLFCDRLELVLIGFDQAVFEIVP